MPSNTQFVELRGGPNPARHAPRRPVPRDPRTIDPLARPETRAERPSRSPGPRDSPPDPPPDGAPLTVVVFIPLRPPQSPLQGFGELLSNLGAQRGMPPAPIDTFKPGGSPIARMYNWNLLGPVFRPFGIVLEDDDRALVVAGDRDFVSNILSKFYERTVGDLPMIVPPSHSYYEEDEPVDIDNGAVTMNADPSPLTSQLAEMGLSDSRGFPGEDDPDAGAGSLPPAHGKLPGERGPSNTPLRSADDATDPFGFTRDPNAPQTPLELLGRSIEGPFGLKRGEGEVLLSRQPATFQEWMKGTDAPRKNSRARGSPVMNWLEVMRVEVKTLAAMMTGKPEAPAEPMSLGAAAAVFDVLGAGLGNKDKDVVIGTLQLLCNLGRRLKDFPALGLAHQWLSAAGGPSVHLARNLVECARGYDATNIRVGDAKAAADAARQAAADAAQGYAPDYDAAPEDRAGAQFSLGFHADDERGPDPRWREASATAAATAELVERFCRGSPKHLKAFLLEDLRVAADARTNPKPYIDALNVLMPALLARGPSPRHALAAEETPSAMLLEALRCAEGPADLRESSLTLLTTLWSAFPDEIEVKGEDCRQAVSVLKRGARDPNPASQIHALACLFQLLHAFINAANAFSPVVYKTIVFMLIEHMRNDPVRDFITAELKVALDTHHNIPVGILVDPVVKQASPGGQHPGLRRVDFALIASMSEHARLEARPALHLLALCLRTALDHVAGDNPADDRAVALRAATRLAARLKGEEAAEEALERAAGGALARIAAEMDEPSDPFFGETQRCAAEVLLATAHSMVAVGGPGVGHLRAIVRDAATNYAARNGVGHPDVEAALHVLSMAVEMGGSYNPSPELIPSPGRRVLPPSPGNRYAPPLASHQREAPPRMASFDAAGSPSPPPPFGGLPTDTSAYAFDTPAAFDVDPTPHPRRDLDAPSDQHQRMAYQSLEAEYDDSPPARFGGAPSSERPPARRQPREREPTSRRAPPSSSRSSANAGGRSPPRRGPGPRASRVASDSGYSHATSKSDLDEQRLKREEEIRQIAIKRAEKMKKLEEAKAREETEKRKMEGKIRAKREMLAKQAKEKGRGGNFASIMSSARAAPAPWRRLPEHEPDPYAEYPDTAEGYATYAVNELVFDRVVQLAREPRPKPGQPMPRKGGVRGAGGFGPPPMKSPPRRRSPGKPSARSPGTGGEPSPAKSRPAPPVVRTTENSFLKQKKEKEAAARAKENEERRKEQERKAQAQAQRAANLKREVELNKKAKEEKERVRKAELAAAAAKARDAKLRKAEAERVRREETKAKLKAYDAKRKQEQEAAAKALAEKKAAQDAESKRKVAEAAAAAKAAAATRPKPTAKKPVGSVGIMGRKPK